jgi:hypothetical protein
MRILTLIFVLLSGLALQAAERAGYDSFGRIIALLSDGGEVEVYSNAQNRWQATISRISCHRF